MGAVTLVLEPHVFACLCVFMRVGTLGQREHYKCRVGGRVQVIMLEHSFSGALSYAQVFFPGHMISSRVREGDVRSWFS